jgi:uncharacterized DUF497 family protein
MSQKLIDVYVNVNCSVVSASLNLQESKSFDTVKSLGTQRTHDVRMMIFAWNPEKNEQLRVERGISFEEIVFHVEAGDVLLIEEHPNQERYPGQRVFSVQVDDYVYLVPHLVSESEIFLKTIIPSRKATKRLKGTKP